MDGFNALLAGCGFELRRPPELRFSTIQLTGFKPRSPLADELRMNIDASATTRVVATLPDQPALVVRSSDGHDERRFSFAELDARVNRLAHVFLASGVGEGDVTMYLRILN